MKTIAIIQSNYIPWKGYFDIIGMCDVFVLYDDVQFTKNDWRNRNQIKTPSGSSWLTVPVLHHSLNQLISETKVANSNWTKKHWHSIQHAYSKAPYFKEIGPKIHDLYLTAGMEYISDVNLHFIEGINQLIGIDTPIIRSSELGLNGDRNERLIQAVMELGGTRYLSGTAASVYLDVPAFENKGITVEWMDYSNYPEYPQLHGPFTHHVSVIDLLMNQGTTAKNFMRWGEQK